MQGGRPPPAADDRPAGRIHVADLLGHLLGHLRRRRDGEANLIAFRSLLVQISSRLDCRLRAEFQSRERRDDLAARPVVVTDLSLQQRDHHVATYLQATRKAFTGELVWSLSTDAARAGFLNRQNTAFCTGTGVAAWGIPVVCSWLSPV